MGSRRNASLTQRGVSFFGALAVASAGLGCEPRREPVPAPAGPVLQVRVAGAVSTWGPEAFASIPHRTVPASSGDSRDVWSLRDLVRAKLGANARVIAVTGDNGTAPVDPAAWTDEAHAPVLHTTGRGTLKFCFEDATGTWGPTLASDVRAIEVVP